MVYCFKTVFIHIVTSYGNGDRYSIFIHHHCAIRRHGFPFLTWRLTVNGERVGGRVDGEGREREGRLRVRGDGGRVGGRVGRRSGMEGGWEGRGRRERVKVGSERNGYKTL